MKQTRLFWQSLVFGFVLSSITAPLTGAVVADRATLNTILGLQSVVEDFEAFRLVPGGVAFLGVTSLDSSTVTNSQGPRLVWDGLTVSAPDPGTLLWQGDGRSGLATQTLFRDGGDEIEVDFTVPTRAVGVDFLAFPSRSAQVTVTVYGSDDATVLDTITGISVPSTGPPVFFGYEDASGIGKVLFDQTSWTWGPVIDNLAYMIPADTIAVASVLPTSRSVGVNDTATGFATIINIGSVTGTNCGIATRSSLIASFSYQTTDPNTNQLTGSANTPVDITAGASQSYLFAITPTADMAPRDVQLSFDCTNSNPALLTTGLNTLLLSASTTPVPDIVALAATPSGDGIVSLPGSFGSSAFAVATVNVGASSDITVRADTGDANLLLSLFVCETDAVGACISQPADSVTTTVNMGETPTFTVFVNGDGELVQFDPANNRIFVRFEDVGGVTRGSTSVAVQSL